MPKIVEWTNDIEPGDVVMWRTTKNFFIVTKVIPFKNSRQGRWATTPKPGDRLPHELQCEKACNRFGVAPKRAESGYMLLQANKVIKMTPTEAAAYISKEIARLQAASPKIAEILEMQSRKKRAYCLK